MSRPIPPSGGGQRQQQPPLSFKTVPGRNRTQKWNQAKTYNYDGDDWGGFDPYDEYGGQDTEPASQQYAPPQGKMHRQQSFEVGTEAERRQFSSGHAPYNEERRPSPAASNSSGGRSGSNPVDHERRRMREFSNPGQVPPPLNMRPGQPPTPAAYQTRKTSVSSLSPAREVSPSPATTAPNAAKPLPFIRPSDIYKRMAEEREKERQSMDSSRPSLDSIQREASPANGGQTRSNTSPSPSNRSGLETADPHGNSQRPLSTVQERPGSGEISTLITSPKNPQNTTKSDNSTARSNQTLSRPVLPPVGGVSDFGMDLWDKPIDEVLRQKEDLNAAPTPPPAAPAISDGNLTGPQSLSHQSSGGLRTVVRDAFDRSDESKTSHTQLSRDDSQSLDGSFTRSNTTSTNAISPIMSRVPSAATSHQRQLERETAVPTIAEEPVSSMNQHETVSGSTTVLASGAHQIARKPSPAGHSRSTSREIAAPQDAYRRSLQASPSPNNSPARIPALETVEPRRLSGPLSAEVAHDPEPSAVESAAPEASSVPLTHDETSPLTADEAIAAETVKPAMRGRSGTNYSLREADLAEEAGSSPEKTPNPDLAQVHRDLQTEFLRSHSPSALASPTSGGFSPSPAAAGTTLSSSSSGRASPVVRPGSRGRVKDIINQFHEIDEVSRRNSAASSKGSLSNLANGSDENLPGLKRKATAGSQLAQEEGTSVASSQIDSSGDESAEPSLEPPSAFLPLRPEAGRLQSFQPHLPGEWISPAPTPMLEHPENPRSEIAEAPENETPSLFPHSGLPVAAPDEEVDLAPTTTKTPLRTSGLQAESSNPLTAVKNAGAALGSALLANVGIGHQARDFASAEPAAPVDQPEMRPHAPTGLLSVNHPPLRRELSDAPTEASLATVGSDMPPTPSPNEEAIPQDLGSLLGHESASTTGLDSDQLEQEILHSLNQTSKVEPIAEPTRKVTAENHERTQDALDAPGNARRIEAHQPVLPPAEVRPADARSALPSQQSKTNFLDQRFSWEQGQQATGSLLAPMAAVGEVEGDENRMSYERPSNGQGLHVVNAPMSPVSESVTPLRDVEQPQSTLEPSVTRSTEHLDLPKSNDETTLEMSPSLNSDHHRSMGTDSHIPSYYGGVTDLAGYTKEVPDVPEQSGEATVADHVQPLDDDVKDLPTPSQQTPDSKHHSGRIPPFREILAINSASDRIRTYGETRQTFADMDTGLGDWLGKMLVHHPEHSDLTSPDGAFQPATMQSAPNSLGRAHRHSPSIMKITKQFAGPFDSTERKASGSATLGTNDTRDGPRINTEKMQTRGKDLMKSASTLGGKAQAGAKGLLAKGRSRFGRSDKAKSQTKLTSPQSASLSSPVLPVTVAKTESPTTPPSMPRDSPLPPAASQTELAQSAQMNASTLSIDRQNLVPTPSKLSAISTTSASLPSANASPSSPQPDLGRQSRRSSLFERFKGSSRSLSRPKSRPTSMILPEGDYATEKRTRDARSQSRPRPSSFMLLSSQDHRTSDTPPLPLIRPAENSELQREAPKSPAAEGRKEAWEAETQDLPARNVSLEEQDHLGVLPSPSTNTFSIDTGSPIQTVKPTEPSGPSLKEAKPPKYRNVSPIIQSMKDAKMDREKQQEATKPEKQEEATKSETDEKPTPVRRQSDLASLPSQVKARQSRPNSIMWEETDDEFYDATPTATRKPWSKSARASRRASVEYFSAADVEASRDKVGTEPSQLQEHVDRAFPEQAADAHLIDVARQDSVDAQAGAERTSGDYMERQPTSAEPVLFHDHDHMIPSEEPTPRAEQPVASRNSAISSPVAEAKRSEISRPTTPATWDKHSLVSSEEQPFMDANENNANANGSRRSSVSSLEQSRPVTASAGSVRQSNIANQVEPQPSEIYAPTPEPEDVPVMSSQAVPAGPIAPRNSSFAPPTQAHAPLSRSASGENLAQEDKFANRQYRAPKAPTDRPASYMPLSRDSQGYPKEEQLDRATNRYSVPIDLSAMSGPPVGAPTFQKHPVYRGQPETYDRVRSPASTNRRYSGFYDEAQASRSYTSIASIPPAHQIGDDQHAIEDLQVSELIDDFAHDEQVNKPAKRRSGIWETFRRQQSSSQPFDSELADAAQKASSQNQVELTGKPTAAPRSSNTLKKKVQRAPSTAVAPSDPKKKRFSGLGSIFGRSSTQESGAPRSNKLSKKAPPVIESPVRDSPPDTYYGNRPATAAGSYEAYEAFRRHQIPDLPDRQPREPPSQPRRRPQSEYIRSSSAARGDSQEFSMHYPAASQEWHDSVTQPNHPGLARLNTAQTRHLRNELMWRERFQDSPEAVQQQPVDASLKRPIAPVAPPPPQTSRPKSTGSTRAASSEPRPRTSTGHAAKTSFDGPFPKINTSTQPRRTSQPRQPSTDASRRASSTPIAARPEHEAPARRQRDPAPPLPVEGRKSVLRGAQPNNSSGNQRRNPTRSVSDQQVPWSASGTSSAPGSRSTSRSPAWAKKSATTTARQDQSASASVVYSPPLDDMYEQYGASAAQHGLGYASDGTRPSAQSQSSSQPVHNASAGSSNAAAGSPASSDAPFSPDDIGTHLWVNKPRATNAAPDDSDQRLQASLNKNGDLTGGSRHKSSPVIQQGQDNGRPLTYQPTTLRQQPQRYDSQASGRSEVAMRGSSYPGQEWAPPAGSHEWD